jgi:hypothetical protein
LKAAKPSYLFLLFDPPNHLSSFGFFCHVFIFAAHYGEGRYHFMDRGTSNGQSLFSMLSPIAATNGVCCKYAAIISIINLGLDLVRESKYPKSICFELYPLRIFAFFYLLEDGFLTIPTILLYNKRSSTVFAM